MNAKYYPLIKLGRWASLMKRRITLPVKLLTSGFLKSESYFPELPRKNRLTIAWEMLAHIVKYGSIEWHYFSYGFDIKGLRNQKEYLDESWFMWKSSMMNTILPNLDKTCLLRDKKLFSEILSLWGFRTPASSDSANSVKKLMTTPGEYFLKPKDGQCGQGVVKLTTIDSAWKINDIDSSEEKVSNTLKYAFSQDYLVQKRVIQHNSLDRIYPNSINTIRLITAYDKKLETVTPFAALLRIGAHGNVVDNLAKGGIAVGIDLASGKLSEYGFYKYGKGTKTQRHPDTGFVFKDFEIPFFQEALRQSLALHRLLLPIAIIGWDIAIAPDGPVFIEGNDNMEIGGSQRTGGGLRTRFISLFPD